MDDYEYDPSDDIVLDPRGLHALLSEQRQHQYDECHASAERFNLGPMFDIRHVGLAYSSSSRRDLLLKYLANQGLEQISIGEVQRADESTLRYKIGKWAEACKVVVQVLLRKERRLLDTMFATPQRLREECFAEATKACVVQLLDFGDAITIRLRSSEMLSDTLGMYEMLASVLPDLETFFSGDSRDFVRGKGRGVLGRLGDAARGTLAKFGNALRRQASEEPLQGGRIHPLSGHVMVA